MEPLVSIITPVYNSEEYLEETILSVINQTYKNWELLLIDDYSTDNSYKIIEKYLTDERIKYLRNERNSGPAITRNIGLEKSKGEYIAFLDSDDIWAKNKLELQIDYMKKNSIRICHGDYIFIDKNGKEIKKIITDDILSYKILLKENQIKTSFLIVNKNLIGEIRFPLIKHEDFAFFLELLKKGEISKKIDFIVGKYRIQENSVSSNKLKSAIWTWNIYRKYERLNLLQSVHYFSNYIYRGLRKYKR